MFKGKLFGYWAIKLYDENLKFGTLNLVFLHPMQTIYNLLIHIATFVLGVLALFNKKMKLFVNGRKGVFEKIQQNISAADRTIWFHCASLGEFEQGLPIMEAVKKLKPDHKIVVSFFSPSGFEIKKNTPIADLVVYLPMDTAANAKKFVLAVHPSLSVFIKYEIWPNYLFELQKNRVPTILVSGLFREKQIFFKNYGSFMRKALGTFEHIFVQNENSKELLNTISINKVTLSGDTRFDRVSHQIETNNTLDFAENFKGNSICIVCGSTWPEDENALLEYINSAPENVKFIIAPHKIEASKIENFRKKIGPKAALYSEKKQNIASYKVLIIDTIGLLTKLYCYADIAYVGGAMGTTGLHNILEPATFGVPIIIGKNYENFPEAIRLQHLAGLFSVENTSECTQILQKLVADTSFRNKTGMIAGLFINKNTGATQKVMEYLKTLPDF